MRDSGDLVLGVCCENEIADALLRVTSAIGRSSANLGQLAAFNRGDPSASTHGLA